MSEWVNELIEVLLEDLRNAEAVGNEARAQKLLRLLNHAYRLRAKGVSI